MIEILRTDGTHQIIRVTPSFFHTEVYGSGKHKIVLTPALKARHVAYDLTGYGTHKNMYLAHKLTWPDNKEDVEN